MSIDFSNEQDQTFDFDFLKVAEDVMETVLDQEGCPYESQVCLVLTDNETIHKTNLEYRQIDRATDVLSFPMVDFPAPADYSASGGHHDLHTKSSGTGGSLRTQRKKRICIFSCPQYAASSGL